MAAKPLLERCYSFNRRVLGSDHPTTIISRDSLKYVLGELGEVGRADIDENRSIATWAYMNPQFQQRFESPGPANSHCLLDSKVAPPAL